MVHFETIWNEAESVVKSYIDLNRKDIFKLCRDALNDLSDGESQEDLHIAMGNMLFGLCSFCAFLEEKQKIEINSAIALIDSIERKRIEILDPE
jgi:hypothetical protein